MRSFFFLALALMFAPPGVHAGEEAPYDMEARRQSVVNLERHIGQRKERLADLLEDTRRLDARVEKRADELVKMLTEIRDSEQSRTRVAQMKMRAIAGLRNWIENYQRRRSRILETLRQGGGHMPKEELEKSIAAFDRRIEKRVSEIMELTASMGDHQDVGKYESTGGHYWSGYYYETSKISDEWRQSRRQDVMTDKNRRELIKALEAAIQRLESRRAGIEDKLRNRKIPESEREVLLGEIGRIDGALDRRRGDLREIVKPQGGAAGEELGRNRAHDIELLLEDASKDLSADIYRVVHSYDEFEEELIRIHKLGENLEARKAWLEKHDK